MDRRAHWNEVYASTTDRDVSWFEAEPSESLALIDAAGATRASCLIDIGGGDSRLVDALLARGMRCLTVLDVSRAALDRARARVGGDAAHVDWIEADVTGEWECRPVDVWHDRAVFHFLTRSEDRTRYVDHLARVLVPGGTAIVATFALDGPERCSGLPVARYSPDTLAQALGGGFAVEESRTHVHTTPWGSTQSFQYSRFRRTAGAEPRAGNGS